MRSFYAHIHALSTSKVAPENKGAQVHRRCRKIFDELNTAAPAIAQAIYCTQTTQRPCNMQRGLTQGIYGIDDNRVRYVRTRAFLVFLAELLSLIGRPDLAGRTSPRRSAASPARTPKSASHEWRVFRSPVFRLCLATTARRRRPSCTRRTKCGRSASRPCSRYLMADVIARNPSKRVRRSTNKSQTIAIVY